MIRYDFNLRDYWRIIRKRRKIVVLSVVLFTFFSYLFALILSPTPLYEATSAVKVEKATDLTSLLLGTVSWTSWDNVATQAIIITSFPIMERTAREMNLIPSEATPAEVRTNSHYLQIINRLKSQVKTGQEENTNIINITVTSSESSEAQLIANTVADVFRQANIEERNKKVRETKEFIEGQLGIMRTRLQEAEQKMRNYEETHELVSVDTQTSTLLNQLASIESEAERLQQRRAEIEKQLDWLQRHEGNIQVLEDGFYVDDPHPALARLIETYGDLSLRRKALLNTYTKEHPEVKGVEAGLEDVTAELEAQLKSIVSSMAGRLLVLNERISTLRTRTLSIPQSALTLARLRREVEANAGLYTQLQSKYQEASIQEAGQIEEVRVIKPALQPSSPINTPDRFINTVTGGIIGLVLGLVLALVLETMDTSIGTIEDVEEVLGIPVLGVIPSTKAFVGKEKGRDEINPDEPLVTHFAPRSPVSEAYRSLRTNIQFIRADKKARIFLVTSSSLQEGKTYNVVNLGLSLAQAGERMLLIDADLRRPVVHRIFGVEREPGLADYILGNYDWEDVVNNITDIMLGEFEIEDILRTPGLDNLNIISAGPAPLNPAEILRSPRFKDLLLQAKEQYDLIIVDTPPVLPVADAFEVAPQTDGVVLVYEVGRIGRGILKRAKIQLENVKSEVLGIILNNVRPDVAPDFYRYRTDYYYEETSPDEGPASRLWWLKNLGWNTLEAGKKILSFSSLKGSRLTTFILLFLIGLLLMVGFWWQNYRGPSSASRRLLNSNTEASTSAGDSQRSTELPDRSSRTSQVAAVAPMSQPASEAPEPVKPTKKLSPIPEPEPHPGMSKPTNESPEPVGPKKKLTRASMPEPPKESMAPTYLSKASLANIRSRPDPSAPVVSRVVRGTRLQVVGKEENWLKLKLRNGDNGWIHSRLVRRAE